MNDLIRDRAVGALLGLAVGDAVGTTLEFKARDSYEPLTDMVGGGPFHVPPGGWTDDTSMALCLGDSLLACHKVDEADLMERFVRWWRQGHNSHTGTCFDIGGTTRRALAKFEETGDPVAGSTNPGDGGNGSLMRLAPISIFWAADSQRAMEAARRQSKTTHAAPEPVDACAFFAGLLCDAITMGAQFELRESRRFRGEPKIEDIAAGSWVGKHRDEISSSGYVVSTLEAALWSVGNAVSFEQAILEAANLGRDADTVAAVAGQLAGAMWGVSGMPQRWLAKLAWRDRIEKLGNQLYAHGRRVA